MTLDVGTKLGAYEILGPAGAGGMGEVYRARDTRLDRTVAIKVLPERVASEPGLRQRFEREAKAISSLNHPNICTLFDVGNQEGVDFLVMEYLQGETLADRIQRKGALPLDDVLRHAVAIAEALAEAHANGVTHRDLKPGNIMLTSAGAKLMDFGLAKLSEDTAAPSLESLSAVPTQAQPLTAEGSIVGTFQYMAPEQLEGKEADECTDIFAFGAVVYEMATGRRAFEGKSQASLIGAILEREPTPISSLVPMAPRALERIVKKCLAKNPRDRWYTAHDLSDALRWIDDGDEARVATDQRRALHYAVTLTTGLALGALVAWGLRPPPERPAVVRFPVLLSDPQVNAELVDLAIAPDGSRLAYVADDRIYLHELSLAEARPLENTEGAAIPFFNPDGQWLGFQQDGQLKKIAIDGGPSLTLCDFADGEVPRWGPDDVIRFGTYSTGIWAVPGGGGTPRPVFPEDGTWERTWATELMPDGKSLLYSMGQPGDRSKWKILARSPGETEPRVLLEGGGSAHYVSTGHLIYWAPPNDLFAVPFDADRIEVTGSPVPLLGGLDRWQFDIADNGTLVYFPSASRDDRSLVWVSRDGVVNAAVEERGLYRKPRLSPGGDRLAVELALPEKDRDIWVYDLERGTKARLTTSIESAIDYDPVWTPDGARVVFFSDRGSKAGLYWKSADGRGESEPLHATGTYLDPHSVSPDGKFLAYYERTGEDRDIWILPLEGDRTPVPLLVTRFNERSPAFSPTGNLLAYVSDESGQDEVYLQTYPDANIREVVSTSGGREPVWSGDGGELFYRNEDRMMAVTVTTEPELRVGLPQMLFEGRFYSEFPQTGSQLYDASPDGERFLMVQAGEGAAELRVVLHWFEELKERVPSGR